MGYVLFFWWLRTLFLSCFVFLFEVEDKTIVSNFFLLGDFKGNLAFEGAG